MIGIASPAIHKLSSALSYNPLGSVVSSCVFDLDATLTDSYGGSGQTWANVEPTPADGAAQTDYDFYLGADSSSSTDDPTFTGSGSSAYFALDGGDFFSLKSGANTTFLKNLHKTTGGADWTLMVAMYASNVTTSSGMYATGSTLTTNNMVRGSITSSSKLFAVQRGTANVTTTGGTSVPGSTPFVWAMGHTHATNATKLAVGATIETPTQTYNTSTTDPTMAFRLMWTPSSTPAVSGTRVYAAAMFNAYLSDSEIASVISEWNTRHGRTY